LYVDKLSVFTFIALKLRFHVLLSVPVKIVTPFYTNITKRQITWARYRGTIVNIYRIRFRGT
jgi:hypothetical protein